MIGISTTGVGVSEALHKWLSEGSDPDKEPDIDEDCGYWILKVDPEGQVFFARNSTQFAGPLEGQFWSVGSGELYAIGAMAQGATAEEAVAIACDLDPWTARPITVLRRKG
jgi:hypothetical protein